MNVEQNVKPQVERRPAPTSPQPSAQSSRSLTREQLSLWFSWVLRIAALVIAVFIVLQPNSTVWRGAYGFGFGFVGVAIGMYLTFRVLNFPDLTIEGSYATGGVIAIGMIDGNRDSFLGNPWFVLVVALICGGLAGLVTGIIHTRFKINGLLAGILVSAALYSLNLRFLVQSTKGVNSTTKPLTIFDQLSTVLLGQSDVLKLFSDDRVPFIKIGLLAIFAGIIAILIYLLLHTQLGLAVRATGDNEHMIRALGVNTNRTKILVLVISNALFALSGALIAQFQQNASITAGQGIIVIGLGAVILGEAFVPPRTVALALIGAIVGALVFSVIQSAVYSFTLTQGTVYRVLVTFLIIAALSYVCWLTLNADTPAWITGVAIALAAIVAVILSSAAYYLPINLANWTIEKTNFIKLEAGDVRITLALLVFSAMAIPAVRQRLGVRRLIVNAAGSK